MGGETTKGCMRGCQSPWHQPGDGAPMGPCFVPRLPPATVLEVQRNALLYAANVCDANAGEREATLSLLPGSVHRDELVAQRDMARILATRFRLDAAESGPLPAQGKAGSSEADLYREQFEKMAAERHVLVRRIAYAKEVLACANSSAAFIAKAVIDILEGWTSPPDAPGEVSPAVASQSDGSRERIAALEAALFELIRRAGDDDARSTVNDTPAVLLNDALRAAKAVLGPEATAREYAKVTGEGQ